MPREYTVLVTGFGANLNAPGGNAVSNPAGLVARMLPTALPAEHPSNKAGAPIRILDSVAGNFDSIPGEMAAVRRRIQELHSENGATVDLWIHLGRGPWPFLTCERLAFRQDFSASWLPGDAQKAYYLGKDNAGQNGHDLGPNPWASVPIGLNSELDVDAVVADASDSLYGVAAPSSTPLQVRSHLEPGPGGCGFAFYESMANCFIAGRRRDVLFVHVPPSTEEENLERVRDAVLAIVGAAVAALVKRESAPPVDFQMQFGMFR